MTKNLKLFAFLLGALTMLFTMSCSEDATPGSVNLLFDQNVDGEELVLETKAYQSSAGHPFYVHRLKYYISEITLHNKNGSAVEFENIHYRDLADENTRLLNLGEVSEGEYNRISFTFGLEEVINIDGGLPNTQTNVNMEWPIPGDQGYHYMKLEGRYDSLGTGVLKNFNLHTGAARGNQNYIEMSLPLTEFNINDNTWSIMLEMDLAEWLKNPNTYDFNEFGPMIMMNQNAQEILKENGKTVFSVVALIKQ